MARVAATAPNPPIAEEAAAAVTATTTDTEPEASRPEVDEFADITVYAAEAFIAPLRVSPYVEAFATHLGNAGEAVLDIHGWDVKKSSKFQRELKKASRLYGERKVRATLGSIMAGESEHAALRFTLAPAPTPPAEPEPAPAV